MNPPDYRQQEELEQRQFEEAQELLKEDAEAYNAWLDSISQELGEDHHA